MLGCLGFWPAGHTVNRRFIENRRQKGAKYGVSRVGGLEYPKHLIDRKVDGTSPKKKNKKSPLLTMIQSMDGNIRRAAAERPLANRRG